jgi:hypothetical protein
VIGLMDSTLEFVPGSLVRHDQGEYALARMKDGNRLAALFKAVMEDFDGEWSEMDGRWLFLGLLNAQNAASLRTHLPWLQPRPLDLALSAGLGDRLGVATPGHVRAIKAVNGKIAPIFIQQSMRENARTLRTPQQVMDDATWGMFAEGWQGPHGADADHLKTAEDIDACLEAGYTFYTIDPGAYVDNRAESVKLGELRELSTGLPKEMSIKDCGLLGKEFDIEGMVISFDEPTLLKSMVKYGRAVDHVVNMYRHLVEAAGTRQFELEVSVDETESPTSHAEHVYIASELKRLGVEWVSLAPRFVGRFEKGVDYLGDLGAFERDYAGHAAIARQFGPYKLSLHSGSDKYSIYAASGRLSCGLVHLKTAGTSYLEALNTLAALDPIFFQEIYEFALGRYETDRHSYHVSADLNRAPLPASLLDWPGVLEQFDAREILHVTFGSVLTAKDDKGEWRFRTRMMDFLKANPEAYAAGLERHFSRHLRPFLS